MGRPKGAMVFMCVVVFLPAKVWIYRVIRKKAMPKSGKKPPHSLQKGEQMGWPVNRTHLR